MRPFHLLDYISIYENACQPLFFNIFKKKVAYNTIFVCDYNFWLKRVNP